MIKFNQEEFENNEFFDEHAINALKKDKWITIACPDCNHAETLGFQQTFDHPEIFINGMRPQIAHYMFIQITQYIKLGYKFEPNVIYVGLAQNDYPLAFAKIKNEDIMNRQSLQGCINLNASADKEFEALQLISSDTNFKFPWEFAEDSNSEKKALYSGISVDTSSKDFGNLYNITKYVSLSKDFSKVIEMTKEEYENFNM